MILSVLPGSPRVLIVAPFPPRRDGFHGGSQSTGRLIAEVAEHCTLAVAYLKTDDEPPMEEALCQHCTMVVQTPRTRGKLRLLGALLRGHPMWVEDWNVSGFNQRLAEIVDQFNPDIIQFDYQIMGQYLDAVQGKARTVLVEHEAGAAAARGRWQASRGWRRAVLAHDARSWERYERRTLAKFDAVVAYTELDRRALRESAPDVRIEVITPAGPALPVLAYHEMASKILFVGNFVHPPNVDAALRLAGSILPRVRARHPDAILQLVGDNPSAAVRELERHPGVVVTGRVPKVAPWFEAAGVVVAPLRLGGGVRVKMMEAFAHAKAVVATPLAVEGLNVRDGVEALLRENDDDFADAISFLLDNTPERERLSANGRRLAESFSKPGRLGQAYATLYRDLASE